jgi:aldehyde:ferredoxin oxidoreductase
VGGYNNKLAYVNLTAKTVSWRELTREECRTWIGGSGLGAKLLFEHSQPDVDPLGPDNPLIFTTGPMTGSFIPGAGRHQVVTKSPLTGIYGEADAGGKWGTVLKASGYDGIIILGQTTRPAYLYVHDGIVEIFDALDLWGLDIYDTDAALKNIHGPDVTVAAIGPAGEQQVLMATIVTEGRKAHTAGRGGLGAVMGSKGLKAIVVAGDRPVPVHDRQRLERSIEAIAATIEKRTAALQAYGTAGGITGFERIGDMPVKNWSQGTWPAVEKISGQTMSATMKTGRSKCQSCPVGCRRTVKNKSRYGSVDGAGPEYETLGMFGGACLIDDLEAITQANELCNRYGIDTISTGAAIAFLMDLHEKGFVDVEKLHGGPVAPGHLPVWGNAEAMLWLIHAIGRREGIGRVLGQGVRRAAEIIGGRAHECAFHVKGLEMPAHDPRAFNSMALGYATSNRGACHLQGGSYFFEKAATMPEVGITKILDRFRTDNQGDVQARLQDIMCLMDSMKLCKFLLYGGVNLTVITEWLNCLTGFDYTVEEMLATGERIFNLKRLYNIRCGIGRADDTLPRHILEEPRPDGGAAGNLPPLEAMLQEYYQARGWDGDGRPSPATLSRLELSEF